MSVCPLPVGIDAMWSQCAPGPPELNMDVTGTVGAKRRRRMVVVGLQLGLLEAVTRQGGPRNASVRATANQHQLRDMRELPAYDGVRC